MIRARKRHGARLALLAAALGLLACGKKGDPLPPLRRTPQPVTELALVQRGERLELSLLAPRAAADGARLPVLEIEIARADGAGEFERIARRERLRAAPGERLVLSEPLPAAGTVLRRQARAFARGRPSLPTPVVTLTVQAPPQAPSGLEARSSPGGVALRWKPPAAEPPPLGYHVLRRGARTAYAAPLTEAPVPGPGFEDAGAGVGEEACYVVRSVAALDPAVESADSEEVCLVVADVAPPAPPTGVATLAQADGIEVSWSPSPESDLLRYRVYRAQRSSAPQAVGEVAAPASSYLDREAQPGRTYGYRITALDRAGNESPPSAPAEGRRE